MKKNNNQASEIMDFNTFKKFLLPGFIGFLIPGAGHLYIKDKKRGAIILILLTITFFSGALMNGKIYTPSMEGTKWDKIISLLASTAELGNGLYYFSTILFGNVRGELSSVYYEVGSIYGITSGLLNFLVLFSLYDLIARRKEKSIDDNNKFEHPVN